MPNQSDHQIDVRDINLGQTCQEADSDNSSTAGSKTKAESRSKTLANEWKNASSDICLNNKWVTDVDRIEVSKEKRRQMMKKARAISQAISKKGVSKKQNIIAFDANQLITQSAADKEFDSDIFQTAAKTDLKHDGRKSSQRITRVQNMQAMTDSVCSPLSLVAKGSPPLSRDKSSRSGWRRHRTDQNGHSTEVGVKRSHAVTNNRTLDNETETAVVTSSQIPTATSIQTVIPDVSEGKSGFSLSAASVAEVHAETRTSDSSLSGCISSSNPPRILTQEMIEKIQLSAQQKSAILIPNAVPARGKHGTAVCIEVPFSENLKPNANVAHTQCSETITSTSPVLVNSSVPSSLSVSSGQSVVTKKRKLNILQYKSILSQRQKTLLQSAFVAQPTAELSTVYVYGRYQDILHDHDYNSTDRHDTGPGNTNRALENPSVLPKKDVVVKDKVSEITEITPVRAEPAQEKLKTGSAAAISVNTTTGTTSNAVTLQLQPATSYSSIAFESRQDSDLAYKVSSSINSSSSVSMQTVAVDCMPAYFDVVSLPNQQTKISVSTATLVTKTKRHNQQPLASVRDNDSEQRLSLTVTCNNASTQRSSEVTANKPLGCDKDIDQRDQPSSLRVTPDQRSSEVIVDKESSFEKDIDQHALRRRRHSETVTRRKSDSSRSSSVSSALSVLSSDSEESSRSRSRSSSQRCSLRSSSHSSDSW